MKKLAIEGHKTRGNEVIELLEMLGGKNIQRLNGALSKCYYIIDNQSISVCMSVENDYVVYTLEEFKDKFPFKVGDKVRIPEYESQVKIVGMEYFNLESSNTERVFYKVYRDDEEEWYTEEELLDINDIKDYESCYTKTNDTVDISSRTLGIKGHSNRSEDVKLLLTMLGGRIDVEDLPFDNDIFVLYIGNNKCVYTSTVSSFNGVIYSLEEFEEKFPYKVGDEVIAYAEGCLAHFTIQDIRWNNKLNKIEYKICSSWYDTSLMQPYKEETIDDFKANTKEIDDKIYTNISQLKVVNDIDMGKNIFGYKPDDIVFVDEINWVKITNKFWDSYKKEFFYKGVGLINQKVYDNISHKNIKAEMLLPIFNVNNNNEHNSIDRNVNDICDDILINQITAKVAIINLKSDVCDDEVELNLGDYEIEIRDNKTYAVLKKPKYPKTYEECCETLNLTKYPPALAPNKSTFISQYKDFPHYHEIQKLAELLICRDAYWKIAGEQMGLGKSWNPDFTNNDEERYGIYTAENKVKRDFCGVGDVNTVLTFPTEEMRDAFYENFKDLIEQCKELL